MQRRDILVEKFVLLLTLCVSVTAAYFSYTTNSILAYNDATAHLNTARRVFDNLTPGLVQLGSVWLPLLHILELPFVTNYTLWQTGLAGSIVSGLSFVAGGFFLYKLAKLCVESRVAALIGIAVYITNINLLYLQTTAMFEPLLIALATIAIYFIAKWAKENTLRDLVLAAFFTMLATLTRYDGWALFIAMAGFILLASLRSGKRKEGPLVIFLFLAGFGIVLWFLYNYLIFKDPLFFSRGEYSAQAQQQILFERGFLPTKHNLPLAFVTYTYAMLLNNGVIPVVFLILGSIFYFIQVLRQRMFWLLSPFLLWVPYAFNIVSLYLGQSVIWLPMIPPYFSSYFNARYGLLMLPAVVFFSAALARSSIIARLGMPILIIFQLALFFYPKATPVFGNQAGIITLKDTVSSVNTQTVQASHYLYSHYTGGLIMVSSASADAFIFRAGIPLHNFITEGTGYYWKESLDNPAKYATYVVFFKDHSDRVGKVVAKNNQFPKQFCKVYEDQTYEIWQKQIKQ